MGIGKRIKEARNALGITQEDLAKVLGVTKGAVANYENETSHPKEPIMYKLFDALQVDANYLFQDVVNIPKKSNDVTFSEYEMVKKYRYLSKYSPAGSKTVDFILDREYIVAQQLQDQEKRIADLEANPVIVEKKNDSILRMYSYIHKIACAGNGFYFEDIPTDTMEAPYKEGADFIAGVNGDSMEPTFKDGDLVYVERRQIIDIGEIGLFIFNNECYIKEAGENGLISHNPKYDIIPGTDQIQCIGKVLGKVLSNF